MSESKNILDKLTLASASRLASKKMREGLNLEAQNICAQILIRYPKNQAAISLLKKIHNENVNILKGNETIPVEVRNTLIDLYNNSKFQELIYEVKKSLFKFPSSSFLFTTLGLAQIQTKNETEAIRAFKRSLEINSKDSLARSSLAAIYNNMAVNMEENGELENAITNYKKAVKINENYPEAYFNLGVAFQRSGRLDDSVESYKKALKHRSHFVEAYLNMAEVMRDMGDFDSALNCCRDALAIDSRCALAFSQMGGIFKASGQLSKAISSYEKGLEINPKDYAMRHLLKGLKDQTPRTADRRYVEKLFDDYAFKFNKDLIEKLKYRIPKLIGQAIKEMTGSSQSISVLELGCGTGLVGIEIRDYSKKIVGIDISHRMLQQAENTKSYDKLVHVDCLEYLRLNDLDFNCFIAADVFIYIGELDHLFHLVKSKNKRKGKFIFTTEHREEGSYSLEKSGRFSHSKSYIDDICRRRGFKIVYFKRIPLRFEVNEKIIGGLYILEF